MDGANVIPHDSLAKFHKTLCFELKLWNLQIIGECNILAYVDQFLMKSDKLKQFENHISFVVQSAHISLSLLDFTNQR